MRINSDLLRFLRSLKYYIFWWDKNRREPRVFVTNGYFCFWTYDPIGANSDRNLYKKFLIINFYNWGEVCPQWLSWLNFLLFSYYPSTEPFLRGPFHGPIRFIISFDKQLIPIFNLEKWPRIIWLWPFQNFNSGI